MQTRSQTKAQCISKSLCVYETIIDFDEASMLWKSNKKSIGNGSYKYICCYKISSSGKNCGKNQIADSQYCKNHNKHNTEQINL